MKKIVVILVLLVSYSTVAQVFGNSSQRRIRASQTTSGNKPVAPKFDTDKAVGYVQYDFEKVAKKIGVKKGGKVGKEIKVLIAKYNKKVGDLKRLNSFTLRTWKSTVEATYKQAIKDKNYASIKTVQKQVEEAFKPIKESLTKEDDLLSASLKELLTEKQFKKWGKYQSKIKKAS